VFLKPFPSLKFVIAHFGGGIAAIKERLLKRAIVLTGVRKPFPELFVVFISIGGFEGGDRARCRLAGILAGAAVFATDPSGFYGVTLCQDRTPTVPEYIVPSQETATCRCREVLGGTASELLKL